MTSYNAVLSIDFFMSHSLPCMAGFRRKGYVYSRGIRVAQFCCLLLYARLHSVEEDEEMRLVICLYVIPWLSDGLYVQSRPLLTMDPSSVEDSSNSTVSISCSLGAESPHADMVYSVLISHRHTTKAVCFNDESCKVHDEHVKVENISMTATTTFLSVKVRNATCADRGDYSCKMAVRRSFRNTQLESDVSHLNVTGKPSGVYFDGPPRLIRNNDGSSELLVKCSSLQRTRVFGWSWVLLNQTVEDEDAESCVYSDEDCLYKCSSNLRFNVTSEEDTKGGRWDVICSMGGMKVHKVLDVSSIVKEDIKALPQVQSLEDVSHLASTSEQFKSVPVLSATVVGTVCVVAMLFAFTAVLIFKKHLRHKCKGECFKRENYTSTEGRSNKFTHKVLLEKDRSQEYSSLVQSEDDM